MKHCLLIGNFGVGNLGDEAIRAYALEAFPDVHWTVVSAQPEKDEVPRLPTGIRSFLTTPWWRTIAAYRRCDAVVFGGGSLLTDLESRRAIRLWSLHARLARLLGKPYLLAFQGIGPFLSPSSEAAVRRLCAGSAFLSVRDSLSAERVQTWDLSNKVIQTFDPVFSLMKKKNKDDRSKNILIVIPRMNSSATFRSALLKHLETGTFDAVHVVLLEPDNPDEQRVAASLMEGLRLPSSLRPVRSLKSLTQELSAGTFVLSQRYHGALAAAALGLPMDIVSQGEGDKLSELPTMLATHDHDALLGLVKEGEAALRRTLS